jgi:hypothetical protein
MFTFRKKERNKNTITTRTNENESNNIFHSIDMWRVDDNKLYDVTRKASSLIVGTAKRA